MGIFTDTCFGCICDKCKEHFISNYYEYSIFIDEQYLRESLAENGWHEIDGKWYCSNCCEYDEEKEEYVLKK